MKGLQNARMCKQKNMSDLFCLNSITEFHAFGAFCLQRSRMYDEGYEEYREDGDVSYEEYLEDGDEVRGSCLLACTLQ